MQGGIVNADDAKTLVGVGLSAVRLIRRGRRETAGHTAVGPTVTCLPFPGRYLDRFVQMKKTDTRKLQPAFSNLTLLNQPRGCSLPSAPRIEMRSVAFSGDHRTASGSDSIETVNFGCCHTSPSSRLGAASTICAPSDRIASCKQTLRVSVDSWLHSIERPRDRDRVWLSLEHEDTCDSRDIHHALPEVREPSLLR
jgi:hypothetical protein